MKRFPHAIRLGGITCKIIWGSKSNREWQKKKGKNVGRFSCRVYDGSNTLKDAKIILHPRVRSDRREAYLTLIHEILHFAKEVASVQKVQYENRETGKVRRVRMTHDEIYKLEVILGDLLWQNEALLKCVCRSCAVKTAEPTGRTATGTARKKVAARAL